MPARAPTVRKLRREILRKWAGSSCQVPVIFWELWSMMLSFQELGPVIAAVGRSVTARRVNYNCGNQSRGFTGSGAWQVLKDPATRTAGRKSGDFADFLMPVPRGASQRAGRIQVGHKWVNDQRINISTYDSR